MVQWSALLPFCVLWEVSSEGRQVNWIKPLNHFPLVFKCLSVHGCVPGQGLNPLEDTLWGMPTRSDLKAMLNDAEPVPPIPFLGHFIC